MDKKLVNIARKAIQENHLIGKVASEQLKDAKHYSGKIADVYWLSDGTGILFRTDRISAFDVVLETLIPYKGVVLTELTKHFARSTDITTAYILEKPDDPNCLRMEKLDMIPIEVIGRRLFGGSGYRDFQQLPLDENGNPDESKPWSPEHNRFYQQYGIVITPDSFAEPDLAAPYFKGEGNLPQWLRLSDWIITPTTKAEIGDHDEGITEAQACKIVGDKWYMLKNTFHLAVYQAEEAVASTGLFLGDTKLEFGFAQDGSIKIGDEIFTGDSSRYYDVEDYAEYMKAIRNGNDARLSQEFSKEMVRQYLIENGLKGTAAVLPEEVVVACSVGYMESLERITGTGIEKFVNLAENPEERIERHIGRLKKVLW